MASPGLRPPLQRLIDRINRSRFFTISLALHFLVILILGGTVLFKVVTTEPSDFVGEHFVESQQVAPPRPAEPADSRTTTFTPTQGLPSEIPAAPVTPLPGELDFKHNPIIAPPGNLPQITRGIAPAPPAANPGNLTREQARQIRGFTSNWQRDDGGPGKSLKQREFQFVAFLGRYSGGNWNSTVRIRNNRVVGGSLPNLLYFTSKASNDKIKTNERDVEILALDSERLLSEKPPFIFITGSRAFKLTDREIENLRNYLQMGGCVWGDSSVPGRRSEFDIAFRREMRRVLPDADQEFEPLPKNHPIFQKSAYFSEVREVPSGINFYQEPVHVMKLHGEIAILYTANDYGDMWQVGLDGNGRIDTGKNEQGRFVTINENLWNHRGTYIRNLSEPALQESYKFGVNIVVHLLTRWEDRLKRAPQL